MPHRDPAPDTASVPTGELESPVEPFPGDDVHAAAAAAAGVAPLAQQSLHSDRISLGTQHPSGVHDDATPDKEIAATAQGGPAARSH